MASKRNKPSLLEAMTATRKAPAPSQPWRPPEPEPAPPAFEPRPEPEPERFDEDSRPAAVEPRPELPITIPEPIPPGAFDPDSPFLDDAAERHEPPRAIRVVGSRVEFSLGTVGCMVVAACFCVALLAAYSTGRRGAGAASASRDVTALARVPANPLVRPAAGDSAATTPPRTQIEQKAGDVDLSRLMQAPPARPANPAEAGPKPTAETPAKAAAVAKPLHYLQIESFRFGTAGRADVLAELHDVRRFLRSRGIETTCRDTGREIILLGSTGVAGVKDTDAVQFKARVEQFGREYRKAGGRYEFKGCFWRSEATLPGKPFEPRQE